MCIRDSFKIFRIKWLWPWPLTSQGHPEWSSWALRVISVGSNIVTLAVLTYFTWKSINLIIDPSKSSKVKSDGSNRKPKGTFSKVLPRVQRHICQRFQDISNEIGGGTGVHGWSLTNSEFEIPCHMGMDVFEKINFQFRRYDCMADEYYLTVAYRRCDEDTM